jgi:hypothetical protein
MRELPNDAAPCDGTQGRPPPAIEPTISMLSSPMQRVIIAKRLAMCLIVLGIVSD